MVNDDGVVAAHWTLGAVSYLNARPLIEGLDADPDITLKYEVPAKLPALLDSGEVDAALVPVIDFLRNDRTWKILPDACIGCDGETFTVRVFSRVPASRIRRLHVDGDSHTSVALAQIIWQEQFGQHLEIVPYEGTEMIDDCEAVLLIGDKVVTHRLTNYDIETDLGSAWKSLTSLPFVFAAWAAPRDTETTALADRLSRARDRGVASASMIAADFGPAMGWPVRLAQRYLTRRMKFKLGPRQREAMVLFRELALRYEIIKASQELVFV